MITIKIARIKRNLTQKQLGSLIGLSVSTINRLETGKQSAKIDILTKIAESLEVQISDLIESI